MDYIIVGFVILVLLFLFNLIGKMMTLRFNLSFRYNIPLGYVFALAMSQLVGLPAVMWNVSMNTFRVMYLLAMGATLLVWGIKIFRNKVQFSNLICLDNKYEGCFKKQWISIALIIIGVIFIYINVMDTYTIGRMSDSAFYIPHILENVNSEHIYTSNPWSGAVEPFNSLYLYVTYELFHSMLINLFSMNGLLFINHGMSLLTFIMMMMCMTELAMKLFNEKKVILTVVFWLFITFVFVRNISDNYFFFFSTDVLQRLPYTGKVLAYFALVPMLYTCLIDFFKNKSNQKSMTWVLILLNLAMMSLTSTGFFIFGIEYSAILFFLLWSKRKLFDEVLLLTLSTWPLLFFVILAKYPMLIVPIIISYLIVLIFYKLKIKWIYPLMKYGLMLFSVLIPVSALGLQLLGGKLGVVSFSAGDFITRIIESSNTTTTIIWIISVVGVALYLKNKSEDSTNQLLFGKVPIYLFLVFINPISCAFVATFMTSTSVYHRLFYILPLFPLASIVIVKIVDKLQFLQSKQPIYKMVMSGLVALLLYKFYTGLDSVAFNKLLNSEFIYKNMVSYVSTDNAKLINEYVPESSKVAAYFTNNLWADELRTLRSLSPHVTLPYNTYTHRRLTENGEYTKEDYYNNQVMMLLNASMSIYDLFIDENGILTDMTNGEALINHLLSTYEYVLFPKYYDNEPLLNILFTQGKVVIAENENAYLIEL